MEASLPMDLLLEVLGRSDPRTAVRYGATCKLLWRHVADPAFHRRLRLRLPPADRFLLGLLYHRSRDYFDNYRCPPPRLLPSPSSFAPSRAVASYMSSMLVEPYEPVASGDGGLVVLRPEKYPLMKLCVCHPVSGRLRFLPLEEIRGDRNKYVLLPEVDNGGGFRLLVLDFSLRTQTFSSAAGGWGPVTHPSSPVHPLPLPGQYFYEQVQPSTVLLGGAVAHWLYRQPSTRLYRVLSLDVITGQPTWTEVPEECHRRRMRTMPSSQYKELLLVPATSDGTKLGLLVSELMAVSMWVLDAPATGSPTWSRHVVIDRARIIRSVHTLNDNPLVLSSYPILLESVAGRSGTVVMRMRAVGIVLLNLRTLEVHQLERCWLVKEFATYPFCTYELDLISLLPSTTS